jgi:hypothetical protein
MGVIDPDWFTVVFFQRCPYCNDKLRREIYHNRTEYYHADNGRGWCKDSNFFNGVFYTRPDKDFLGEGYPCP